MNTRQPAFGFSNPFAGQNRNTNFRRQGQPQPQQGFGYEDEVQEDDPRYATQAYMKIGFQTSVGTKFLNFGKTDKQLREASPLEAMILAHWRAGRDVNELLESMVIEIHDANPDLSEMAFVTRSGEYLTQYEEEEAPAPKPRKARTSTKQQEAAE